MGGCLECRRAFVNNGCEFDGKISVVKFRGRYIVYGRANMKAGGGGRFVQAAATVATAEGPQKGKHDVGGPYGPFSRIHIGGYHPHGPGNIYFAAVKPNPLDDQQRTLLGLFPVNMGRIGRDDGNGLSFVGLSISCDGFFWSPLVRLIRSRALHGRAVDHPVDGFLFRNGTLYVLIHRHVPGIATSFGHQNAKLATYRMNTSAVLQLTRAAMPRCRDAATMVTEATQASMPRCAYIRCKLWRASPTMSRSRTRMSPTTPQRTSHIISQLKTEKSWRPRSSFRLSAFASFRAALSTEVH